MSGELKEWLAKIGEEDEQLQGEFIDLFIGARKGIGSKSRAAAWRIAGPMPKRPVGALPKECSGCLNDCSECQDNEP